MKLTEVTEIVEELKRVTTEIQKTLVVERQAKIKTDKEERARIDQIILGVVGIIDLLERSFDSSTSEDAQTYLKKTYKKLNTLIYELGVKKIDVTDNTMLKKGAVKFLNCSETYTCSKQSLSELDLSSAKIVRNGYILDGRILRASEALISE
jgi:molecular chaperone GrpE (heat shock protein)